MNEFYDIVNGVQLYMNFLSETVLDKLILW